MQRLKVNIIKCLIFFYSHIATLATSKSTQWTFFEIILLKSTEDTDRNALWVVFLIHKNFGSKFPKVGLCLLSSECKSNSKKCRNLYSVGMVVLHFYDSLYRTSVVILTICSQSKSPNQRSNKQLLKSATVAKNNCGHANRG